VADREERARSRILAAALKEFGAHGYRGARIEAIARRARVPRGLIAYYFGTKEGLFQALGQERAQAVERVRHQVESGPDDPFAWTLSLFALGSATSDWVHLLIWEGLEWEPDGETQTLVLESGRREFWQDRIAAVRRFQARGKLPAHVDAEQLTFFLYTLGLYPYLVPQIAYLITGRWPSDEKFQADFERFIRGVADRFALAAQPLERSDATGPGR
jgi:TetR/AcrR family transcriptional regulator